MKESQREPFNVKVGTPLPASMVPNVWRGQTEPSNQVQERQARALERIADTLDRMLAVMLDEGEPEAVDPGATLDDPSDPRDLPLPFDEDEHSVL